MKQNKKARSRELRHGEKLVTATLRTATSRLVLGDYKGAEELYRAVLRQSPNEFEALHMLGVLALRGGQALEAATLLGKAVQLNATPQVFANLGSAFLYAGRPDDAIQAYSKSLALDPNLAGVLSNLGTTQQSLQRYADAAESFGRLLRLEPEYNFARGNLFQCNRYSCDWRDFEEHAVAVRAALAAGKNVDRPFPFLSVAGSGLEQLQCARLQAAYLCPDKPAAWTHKPYGHDRIRIAYVSADYFNHVVMKLLDPILERHDRRRFHTIGVSFARSDPDSARPLTRVEQFVDASNMSDHEVAKQLRELEVDIVVDLTGFTDGCRLGIFARRPAPVQVNFLGFPGSMGTSYHDYIIADEFVAPDSCRAFYSEHIARLPDTFQANGRRAAPAADLSAPSRGAADLPAEGVVLCSFNNSYKLNPTMFGIWMRVMQRTPDSVLWLVGNADIQRHLRAEAERLGISGRRLIFAPRLAYDEYLERLQLADLFLDTLPFNAGATASDALWAGVPIVTCPGEAFASRMAGSVLRALGLPELIASNLREYEQLAIDLANAPLRLAELKARLIQSRETQPLFDDATYCRHLEAAYEQMWQRAERGEPAADFAVQRAPPPITVVDPSARHC